MNPLLDAWNCTPQRLRVWYRWPRPHPVGVPFCQMLHGHWATAPVVKLHENGPLIGVPEAFCAPDTVAVYVVLAASELFGVNVATVSAALKPTDPATLFPPESFTVNDTVLGVTGWENVADGATDTATPVAPEAGRHARHRRRRGARRLRVHHVDPVVVVVVGAGREGVRRRRRRRPRRRPARSAARSSPPTPAPARCRRVMPGTGEVRRHVRRPRGHRHRAEKSSSCHPLAVSPVNVPLRQQRPGRGPQAAGMRAGVIGLLVEPHPGDDTRCWPPGTARPRSARWDRSSPPRRSASRSARCCTGTAARPVVKLHENGPLIGVPEAFCAPDTVAVYVVPAASELDGVNVATVFAAAEAHRPGHGVPARVLHRERHRARRHRLRERRRRRHRHRHPRRPRTRRHARHRRRRHSGSPHSTATTPARYPPRWSPTP